MYRIKVCLITVLLFFNGWAGPVAAERACNEHTKTLDCFVAHKTYLLPQHKKQLDRIANDIKHSWTEWGSYYPVDHVTIIGHSSKWRPTDPVEEKALERAQNTADYLRDALSKRNVTGVKIVVAGASIQEPVTTNDTKQGRNINRRVEIFLRSKIQFNTMMKEYKHYARDTYNTSRVHKITGQTCHSDIRAEEICKNQVSLTGGADLVASSCLPWSVRCVVGEGRK